MAIGLGRVMGFTYKELDTYLSGGKIDDAVLEKIQRMHARSEHKRKPIMQASF